MFGVILLIFGLSIFWKTGMNLLGSFYHVPEFIWRFGNNIPQLAMAFVILYMALRMMKEPKEIDTEQNESLEEEQDAVVE